MIFVYKCQSHRLPQTVRYWPKRNVVHRAPRWFVEGFIFQHNSVSFPFILYHFSLISFSDFILLWKSGMLLLMHLQQCIKWRNFVVFVGDCMPRMASTFCAPSWYPSPFIIRPHYITFFTKKRHCFADRRKWCFSQTSKNVPLLLISCCSVFVCKMKSSIQTFIVFAISWKRGSMVAWKFEGAFFNQKRARVGTKVPCGKTVPQASCDIGSKTHCQYPATKFMAAKGLLSLKSNISHSIMCIGQ